MQFWKTAAATGVLLVAVGIGAAFAPEVHGQTATVRRATPEARAQVLAGRGSQIGVGIRDLDDAEMKSGKAQGVVIEDVTADSPAEKAGIKKGDVVVEFDGERVRGARQFTRIVQETPVGRRVPAVILRDGQRTTLTVETRESSAFRLLSDMDVRGIQEMARNLSEDITRNFRWDVPPAPAAPPRPPAPGVPPAPPAPPAIPDIQTYVWRTGNMLGLTVGDLSPQLATYFGTKEGVLVTSVYDDSAAAKAGVKAGDVITSLDGMNVTSPSDLRRRMQRLEAGTEFTMGIVRDKKPMTVKGKVEESRSRRYTYTRTSAIL